MTKPPGGHALVLEPARGHRARGLRAGADARQGRLHQGRAPRRPADRPAREGKSSTQREAEEDGRESLFAAARRSNILLLHATRHEVMRVELVEYIKEQQRD